MSSGRLDGEKWEEEEVVGVGEGGIYGRQARAVDGAGMR
jgi:hypothetical protein